MSVYGCSQNKYNPMEWRCEQFSSFQEANKKLLTINREEYNTTMISVPYIPNFLVKYYISFMMRPKIKLGIHQ